MTQSRPSLSKLCCTVAICLISLAARGVRAAPTKNQCVDADTQAQNARRDGQMLSAREALHLCVADACPKLVRVDCARRLEELEAAIPTITFEVKDGSGQDLSAVTVLVDGKPFADRVDGTAVEIDPGEHVFTFQTAHQPAATRKLVIQEGERRRREVVTIGPVPTRVAGVSSASPAGPPSSASASSSPAPARKYVALGLGALGVVGIGFGTAFGLNASARWSDSKNECPSASNCYNHGAALADRSSALNSARVSTISFIAGGAALAAGTTLFVLDWRKRREQVSALRLTPVITANGASLWLGGTL